MTTPNPTPPADDARLLSVAQQRAALWRASYSCERCGYISALGTFVRQREPGVAGYFSPANCSILCWVCALWLSANPAEAAATGYALGSCVHPETVPMQVTGRGWCRLTGTGEYAPMPSTGQRLRPAA